MLPTLLGGHIQNFFIFWICFFVGLLNCQAHYQLLKHSSDSTVLIGKVIDIKTTALGATRLHIRKNWFSTGVVYSQSSLNCKLGDIVKVEGIQVPEHEPRNPGEPNLIGHYLSRHISQKLYLQELDIVKKRNLLSFYTLSEYLQNRMLTAHQKWIPDKAALLLSMVFGNKTTTLDEKLELQFKKSGLTHLLVASGAQISLLSGIVLTISRQITQKKWVLLVILVFTLSLFWFLAGGGFSVERAIVMSLLAFSLSTFYKKIAGFTVFILSGLLLSMYNPFLFYDIGAQLSFLATFSLIFGVPITTTYLKQFIPNFLAHIVALSVVPSVFTFPIIWFHFNTVQLVGFFSNICIIFWVEWLVILGFTSSVLGALFSPLASLLDPVCYLALITLESITSFFSKLSFLEWFLPQPNLFMLMVVFIGIIILFSGLSSLKKHLIFSGYITLSSVFVFYFLIAHFPTQTLTITFLDVGQGDAIVIQTPRHQTLLIDAGNKIINRNGNVKDYGEKVVAPALKSMGINTLNWIIPSHFHSDHVGGLPFVLSTFKSENMLERGDLCDMPNYFKTALLSSGAKRYESNQINTIELEPELHLTVYRYPASKTDENLNNRSVVLKLNYKNVSVLFTGDCEETGEQQLVERYGSLLKATVLKVGHHGSQTSSTPYFLNAVKPQWAVISVGEKNRYRHPSPTIVERLKQNGAQIFRTDKHGAIVLKTNGEKVIFKTYLKG